MSKRLSRRLAIGGALSIFIVSKVSLAQDQDWQKDLEVYLRTEGRLTLGHILPPANDKSWIEAHDILSKAPTIATPYEVAEYFKASVPPQYQRSWPEPDYNHPTYANPVIVLFFVATKTAPAGDTTAWCAAFANWCLNRVGIDGTKCAASQSFLDWGHPVWSKKSVGMPVEAQTGDIALFRKQSNPKKGHVCFFQKISTKQPNSIEVVGGNQIRGTGENKVHLIDVATMRVDGDLELCAIRTQKGLRHV